jgi:hypothetical protein
MDEPGALLPGQVRPQGRSTDEAIGLLRIWDGYLRSSRRPRTFRSVSPLCRYVEGHAGRKTIETKRTGGGAVHGRLMANGESVLGS